MTLKHWPSIMVLVLSFALLAAAGKRRVWVANPAGADAIEVAIIGPELFEILEGGISGFLDHRELGETSTVEFRQMSRSFRLSLAPEFYELGLLRDQWIGECVWPSSEDGAASLSLKAFEDAAAKFVDLPLIGQIRLLTMVQDAALQLGDRALVEFPQDRGLAWHRMMSHLVAAVAVIRMAYPIEVDDLLYGELADHRWIFGAVGWEHLFMEGRIDGEEIAAPSHNWPVGRRDDGAWEIVALVSGPRLPATVEGTLDLVRELMWRRSASSGSRDLQPLK